MRKNIDDEKRLFTMKDSEITKRLLVYAKPYIIPFLFTGLLMIVSVGCTVETAKSSGEVEGEVEVVIVYKNNTLGNELKIKRIRDDEKGVTCWVSHGFRSGGISCVPDSQLITD